MPASEITRLGLQGNLSERIVEAGGPGYEYRPIELFERPRDNSGRLLPPSDRLWLALGKSAAEKVQRRKLRAALTDDWLRFNRVTEADPSALREIGRELFLGRFGEDAVEAWQHSTTAGDGLLALLGTDVEKAMGLLRTHLRLIAGVDSAVQAIPTLGDGDTGVRMALARAINTSSERILEALSVARASRGRSGLSVPRAELAQEQLLLLVSALAELAAGRGTLKELSKTELEVRRLDIAVPSAIVSVSFGPSAPAGKTASVEIRISGREGGASSRAPLLRLSHSASTGPVWELMFALERVDWGVHGASPINPFKPAHTFFDGMPTFRGLAQGEGPEEPAARFGEYVEERLIPALAGD